MRHQWQFLKDEVKSVAQQINLRTNGFAGLMYGALDRVVKHAPRESASLAYYALFSLFPLLLLLMAILGQIIGPATISTQIKDFLRLFLPGETATALSESLERFVNQGFSASLVASLFLAWSALGLFSNLDGALSRTFRDTNQRPWWQRRIAGVLMILALGLLLVANLLTSLIFSFLDLLFLNQGNIWLSMLSLFVPFGFSMGIFAMMYRWIPRTKLGWDAIWPAALVGGVLWEFAKRGFGWYLDNVGNYSVVYGSITTVIIFMLWAYTTGIIILLCAELCVAYHDWLILRRAGKPEYLVNFADDYYHRELSATPDSPP